VRRFFFLIVLLPFFSLTLSAQDTATIVGSVTDPTAAVIPGVKVTVSNPDKGFTRQLESNAAGEYTAAKIPIGRCVVTAEARGFQRLVRSGITLAVGQTLRVDLAMKVGEVTQELTVTGNVPKVETETAAVSDVVTGSQIADLELNGRNFVALALLVPGASPIEGWDSSAVGIFSWLGISFNGGRYMYNNWELDGGNNTDEGSAGSLNTYPSLDTIAEFRISTSNYGAEMGKHSGATIEVATKAGTKNFHGEAFEYLRNDKLDANDWFVNRQINPPGGNAPKTPLKWNDFGYNLGGPFYIPGHYNADKSKTFFFWSENWRRYRQGTVISGGAPTLRMRQGDFSECDPASSNFNPAISGCALPINPDTGAPFPGDLVPVDPNAKALVHAFVGLPNNGVIGYVKAPSVPTDWRQEQIRVDQNIGDQTRLFVRYTQDAYRASFPGPEGWGYSTFDSVVTKVNGPGKSAVLNLTRSFKPNLMNEFVMGYTQDVLSVYPEPGPDSPAGSLNKPSTWSGKNLFPPNQSNPLLPGFYVCGGLPFCIGGDAGSLPWFNSNPIITWKDNAAWTVGKHTMKFGFFLEKYRKNEQFGYETQGYIGFGNWSSVTTGNALADMYLGRMWQYTEGTTTVDGVPVGGYPKGHYRMTVFEPYFQDDWKVNRKLTLNLGARYHLFVRMHDVSHPTVVASFIPSLYDPGKEALLDASGELVLDPATGHVHDYTTYGNGLVECGSGGIPSGCADPDYRTLAPRFGFAYDPWGKGKTVIRGGYGIYYEMGNGNETNTEGVEGNPPVALAPSGYNIVGFDNITPGATFPTAIMAIPLHSKWGSVQQFSLGMQHEFPGSNLFSLGYVGSLGRHLSRCRELNQVPIGVKTMQAPELAGWVGTNGGNPSEGIPGDLNLPLCDAAGNCDVQTLLLYDEVPNTFFVPYRGYTTIGMNENTAVSNYNSLQANFRHTFGQGLTIQTSYTWSHAIDDASTTYSRTGIDDSDLSRWRATSAMNRTQVLEMNYTYELPFFKKSSRAAARSLLGGWKVSGITSFFTGVPIDFTCGIAGLSSGIGEGVKCNSLGKLRIKKGVVNDPEFGPTPTWFDPNTIGQVTFDQLPADGQPGMFGYMGRNVLTGPGRNNWDMALLKDFELPWFGPEHSRLQFRWETFNSFNHPQWGFGSPSVNAGCGPLTPPGSPCGPATLPDGTTINRYNGQVNAAWPPRIMQFGLKLIF
jgi:hypothetical protein